MESLGILKLKIGMIKKVVILLLLSIVLLLMLSGKVDMVSVN